MQTPRITVVGSYATGLTMRVPRLPTVGETLIGTGYRVDYGGKGSNQAVGCARLGANVTFIARIGNDAFGDMAIKLYAQEGIDTQFVRRVAEAPTGVGFILVEEGTGNNCIAIDPGANNVLGPDEILASDAAFTNSRAVVCQLEIPTAAAQAALHRGRERGAVTVLNPAPVRPLSSELLSLVDVLTPNAAEAKVLAGLAPEACDSPEDVGRILIGKGAKQIVMTLGEQGAIIMDTSSVTRVPAVPVRAVDTTGAGDAFNAGLSVALASGARIHEAVEVATVCGGLSVTREGVVPSLPYRRELLKTFEDRKRTVPPCLLGQKSFT